MGVNPRSRHMTTVLTSQGDSGHNFKHLHDGTVRATLFTASAMSITRRSLVLHAAMAVGLVACLSPTLPLPPPEAPDSVGLGEEEGVFHVRGSCTPGALVLVQNLRSGLIWGIEDKDADGRYSIRVEGKTCDPAQVRETIGSDTSDATFFILEVFSNGTPDGECQ